MTDEAKALVEALRGDWPEILVEKHWMMDSDAIDKQREEAADLIETQAREIERLRHVGSLLCNFARHDDDCRSYKLMGCNCGYTHAWKKWRAALAGDSHDQ